ncbi:hypothetical protein J2X06_001813 [Lysobacter niastensis]|uniref:Uncharacterized protein n=1 Tax=Lysobacter niastensis TaxID=380629 RepID=A0ABU1WAS1_9GAMM|nr:hypothetical protein [Lysobacter niastensis]
MAIDGANAVIAMAGIGDAAIVVASDTMIFRGADPRQWDCEPRVSASA